MAEFSFLPIATDSLLADTDHLSNEEFGIYLRILIKMWRAPACRLPCADALHMRLHKVNSKEFNRLYKPILNEFFSSDGNYYTQKRLSAEFKRARLTRQKRSVAANIRWNKEKDPCKCNAPTPTPSPTPSLSISERDIRARAFDEFWSVYPRHVAKKNAINAFAKAIKGGTTHEIIIAGARRYADECKTKEQRYIAHAASWLNAGRWEDSPGANLDHANGSKPNGYAGTNRSIPKSKVEIAADVIRELEENQRH
jgi:uncharacterized protein YdaU (DUF1376 family)